MKTVRSACALGLLVAAAGLVGCNGDRLTAGELRRNPTPELDHTAASNDQIRNDHARILDNQFRMFWDDIDRLLLVDDNRMLTPYSAPNY